VRASAVRLTASAAVAAALLVLAGCGADSNGGNVDPDQVDAVEAPEVGACRLLTPADARQPTNASRVVDCSERHTAETFAVDELPDDLKNEDYDSPKLAAFAYETCSSKLQHYLGGDVSTVMRTIVSWVWFRPSEKAWDKGARWYRCDVVGGGTGSTSYVALPATVEGLLATQPANDDWMACVNGSSVQSAPRIPCSAKHNWRAVTTIKVGDPGDPYPGDKAVQETTRDYCSSSVGAWLGYPPDYDFGYTWFHQAEWDAGNRRSVCWAATTA
jgi:hypothetical protein